MEKKEEKVQEQPKKSKMEELDEEAKKQGKKTNKTWEAFGKSKGCLINKYHMVTTRILGH